MRVTVGGKGRGGTVAASPQTANPQGVTHSHRQVFTAPAADSPTPLRNPARSLRQAGGLALALGCEG
eukprot:3148889-Pyramimonas_sp.AAC.1